MLKDIHYGLRQLIKSPGFTIVAGLTLALGIGANTAIFSVVEGTLLRPLPFPKADRLVRVYEATDENGGRAGSINLSERTVRQWREHGGEIFEGLAAATGANVTVGALDNNSPRSIQAARITSNFLSVLDLQPALGRNFTQEEDHPGGPSVVIISDYFWQQYLGRRSDVLGMPLILDGVAHTIVGIMPKTFRHPYRAELWLPLAMSSNASQDAVNHYLYGVARLQPGLTPGQASVALRRLCRAINDFAPDPNNPHAAYLPSLRDSFVIDMRPKLLVIAVAALCALLIAATNFAGLLFTRVVEREGEFALRAALGASRRRLVRQQLVHAIILTVVGTLAGLLVAYWVTPALVALSPEGSDLTGSAMREFDCGVRFDWPVFAFAAGVMLLVGIAFGMLPAIRASRVDLRVATNSMARGLTLDRRTRRLLGSFVVIQLAIAAALLIASLAAGQYFRQLANEPWGFATERRIAFDVAFSEQAFASPDARQQAIDAILAQLRGLHGAESATVTAPSPMNAPRDLITFNVEGLQPPEPRGYYLSYFRATVPDYFKNIGEPLLHGRDFSETDGPDSPPACIVSQSFARRFWPDENPIGKRIKWGRLDGPHPWFTVVGVAADMRAIPDPDDGEVIGTIALPFRQLLSPDAYPLDEITFVVQTDGNHTQWEAAIRAAVIAADSRLAAYRIVSLDDAASQSLVTERFVFVLVSLFGALGLVLAAIGLYGLLSLYVARRRHEFGIRSALGATAAQIVQLIARQSATLIAVGFAAGGTVTWGVVRIVRSQWSAMPAPNILSWAVTAAVLSCAALASCWIPARRAALIDPIVALRAE